ncbi:MAG: hypothetical protein AB1440_29855 [Pseudomonadota bacterium]
MRTGGKTNEFGAIRSELGQLIIGAVIIALGAGIVASGIVQIFAAKALPVTLFGFGFLCVGLLVAAWRVVPARAGKVQIDAALLIDSRTRVPISIERYDFSSRIFSYIKALSVENKALGKVWSDNKFYILSGLDTGDVKLSSTESKKIAIEAAEYFVLDSLSTHLTDYFNQEPSADPEKLVTFERDDVPEIFAKNRFLDLFSRPMNEREVFSKTPVGPGYGKVVSASGPGGARYDHFDLVLPKGAKISRDKHGSFSISTKNFTLKVDCDLQFGSHPIPWNFIKYYMSKKFESIDQEKVSIEISVMFSIVQVFSKSGIQYYRWVDDFLEKITHQADFEEFLQDIGWETALTSQFLTGMKKVNLLSRKRTPADQKTSKAN